jgi:hypothetical protein
MIAQDEISRSICLPLILKACKYLNAKKLLMIELDFDKLRKIYPEKCTIYDL